MSRKHWRRSLAGSVVAVLVVVAGCNGGDDDQAGGSTTTEATTTSTTTTTTQPTTTTTPIAGPAPWTGVVQDLFQRDWALQTNPDPNAVAALYSESCSCYRFFVQSAQGLVASGQHHEGVAPAPVALKLEPGDTSPFYRLTVKLAVGPQQVVDASGAVVSETPGRDPLCVSILVAATGANQAYQIHDYFLPERCPDDL
jgi:hypothetical protein